MKTIALVGVILALVSSAFAENNASVARSFSGGSATADKIVIASAAKSDRKIAEDARAMPKLERPAAKVATVRRSFSGGSAAADTMPLAGKAQ